MHSPKSSRRYSHSLSGREATILTNLSFDGKSIFTTEDLPSSLGISGRQNLLKALVRKGWVLKVRKGVYALVPMEAGDRGAEGFAVDRLVVASSLVEPYYIGYWSALNYHGLTDQIPAAVYVATTKPRASRQVMGYPIKFVTLPSRKFFGSEDVEVGKAAVRMSTVEKTIVDCLDHPEHCGGVDTVASALFFNQADINIKTLVTLARKIGNSAVLKRLGFLAEVLGIGDLAKAIARAELKSGYSPLDPSIPRRGKFVEKWKIIANVPMNAEQWMR